MIRRVFAASLALLIALSGAPDLRAQVIGEAASASVPRVTGSFGAVSGPALTLPSSPAAVRRRCWPG